MFKRFSQLLVRSVQHFSACQLCGLESQHAHGLCQDCWQQLPWFQQNIVRHEREIQAILHYQFPIDRIIQKFKYEQQLHYQHLLAQLLLQKRYAKIQAIVAMPISTQRLAERGYNQMLVIAKLMAAELNIPIWQPVTRLAQYSQKGLSRVERLENIEMQFKIIPAQRRKYQRVLIIDDVVTTGSSVNALADALERLGCRHIQIACIAAAES